MWCGQWVNCEVDTVSTRSSGTPTANDSKAVCWDRRWWLEVGSALNLVYVFSHLMPSLSGINNSL